MVDNFPQNGNSFNAENQENDLNKKKKELSFNHTDEFVIINKSYEKVLIYAFIAAFLSEIYYCYTYNMVFDYFSPQLKVFYHDVPLTLFIWIVYVVVEKYDLKFENPTNVKYSVYYALSMLPITIGIGILDLIFFLFGTKIFIPSPFGEFSIWMIIALTCRRILIVYFLIIFTNVFLKLMKLFIRCFNLGGKTPNGNKENK